MLYTIHVIYTIKNIHMKTAALLPPNRYVQNVLDRMVVQLYVQFGTLPHFNPEAKADGTAEIHAPFHNM